MDSEVRIRPLSCCRIHPLLRVSFFTDGGIYDAGISWCLVESSLLFTYEMVPLLLSAKPSQSLINLSPCLPVWKEFFSWCCSFFVYENMPLLFLAIEICFNFISPQHVSKTSQASVDVPLGAFHIGFYEDAGKVSPTDSSMKVFFVQE